MSHRRDSGSDAFYVPTNDPPPENRFPNPGKATDDDYSRVSAVSTDDTESPCEKIRGSPAETRAEFKISAESGRSCVGRQCTMFYSREGCHFGESCIFSHDEASRNRESCAISLGPRGNGAGDGGDVARIVRRKTGICYQWEATKNCDFGNGCRFAHGAAELHRFGGGLVQGEGTIGTSSTPETKQTGQAEKVTSLVSPGVPSQRPSNAVSQKPPTRGKWPDKINGIYGDWIEDLE